MGVKENNRYLPMGSIESVEYNQNFDAWMDIRKRIYESSNLGINQDPFRIKIDAKQPGTGKTSSMLEYIKNHPEERHLIIAPSHEFLDEIEKQLGADMNKLVGFEKCCNRLKDAENFYKKVKSISPSLVCRMQKCKGWCSYRNQFNQVRNEKHNIVGMPVQFLLHDDINFNQYDNIFIEERLPTPHTCRWDKEEIIKEVSKIYTNKTRKEEKNGLNPMDLKMLDDFKQCVLNSDFDKFKELHKELASIVSSHNWKVLAANNYKSSYKRTRVDDICKVNLSELFFCLAFINDSTYKNGHVEIPWEYILFYKQLKSGKNLTFNCASFRETKFFYRLNEFSEIFPEHTARVEIIESMRKNHNTKIIKKSVAVYKSYNKIYFDRYYEELRNLIRNEKYNNNNKVCVLSHKELVDRKLKKKGLQKRGSILGADAFWFGASHGVNRFRNYDVLIVFGEHLPSSDNYIDYFLRYHRDESFPDLKMDTGFVNGKPKDTRLEELYYEFQKDIYDSVHRLRPLSNNIKIYWYGYHIPVELHEEFEVVYGF